MEEYDQYEAVGIQNQGTRSKHKSRGFGENRVYYMMPNEAQFDKETEYDHLQIGTPTANKKQSHNGYDISQSTSSIQGTKFSNGNVKKRRGHIAIFILLTIFGVITVIALAVGALGLKRSLIAQYAIKDESQNYTQLLEEISALKLLLSQLNHETQVNISQLNDRLLSSMDSLSSSASSVSSKAYWNSCSVSRISHTVSELATSVSYCTFC